MAGPLNYTTKVAAHQTIAECGAMLAEHGADAIATTYTDKRPSGVRFQFQGNTFDLPVDVDAMQRVLTEAAAGKGLRSGHVTQAGLQSREHAERVAWRVIKDWLEAQLALVAAQQVHLDEVMLPYLITNTGRALRENWRDHLALPAAPS
jgi:hypothetical protein